MSDYLDQFIIPRLQTVNGVATVITYGRQASAMRIWLDPAKMASSDVAVNDINNALMQQNMSIPSGQIKSLDRYYNVVMNQNLRSAAEFNELIIRKNDQQVVRLKNVGEAMIGPQNEESAFRVEGVPAEALGIIPQTAANPLELASSVLKAYAEILNIFPLA